MQTLFLSVKKAEKQKLTNETHTIDPDQKQA
jgi:hypothetical protein